MISMHDTTPDHSFALRGELVNFAQKGLFWFKKGNFSAASFASEGCINAGRPYPQRLKPKTSCDGKGRAEAPPLPFKVRPLKLRQTTTALYGCPGLPERAYLGL